MKTNPKIAELLTARYTDELKAINQYEGHYATMADKGFVKLATQFKERADDERKHAAKLAERLALFGVAVSVAVPKIGGETGCEEMLDAELPLEMEAIARYNELIGLCATLNDNDTRELVEGILKDETEHVHEIEQAQGQIEMIGLDNFLQAMM